MEAYRKRMAKFPLKLPSGPQDELCPLYEGLHLDVMAPPKRAQPRNSWISAPTWGLIDRRASLRKHGKLSRRMSRLLGRQIASALKRDRQQRAADVAENIDGLLAGGETKEAWRCLKGWYKAASDAAPAASHLSLAAQTAERGNLYQKVPPPGAPIPIHVDKADFPDGPPSDGELRNVVWGLRNRRAAAFARRRRRVL